MSYDETSAECILLVFISAELVGSWGSEKNVIWLNFYAKMLNTLIWEWQSDMETDSISGPFTLMGYSNMW